MVSTYGHHIAAIWLLVCITLPHCCDMVHILRTQLIISSCWAHLVFTWQTKIELKILVWPNFDEFDNLTNSDTIKLCIQKIFQCTKFSRTNISLWFPEYCNETQIIQLDYGKTILDQECEVRHSWAFQAFITS